MESKNWVEHIVNKYPNKLFNDVYIPGSNSACSYIIKENIINLPVTGDIYTRQISRQKLTIEKQFLQGIRAFYVSATEIGDEIYIVTSFKTFVKHMKLSIFADIIYNLLIKNNESIFVNIDIILHENNHPKYLDLTNRTNSFFENTVNTRDGKYIYVIKNVDERTKFSKNTIYISNNNYYNIITNEHIKINNKVSENIYDHIKKALKNNNYNLNFLISTYISHEYYNDMYTQIFFGSFFLTIAVDIILYYISTIGMKKIDKKEINFLLYIIFYACLIALNIFLILLFFNYLISENYILGGKYYNDMIQTIIRLNNENVNFDNKVIFYDMCNEACNKSIYSRNN